MEVNEFKINSKLMVGGEPLGVLLHLIEIRYNKHITFWNGVMELTLDQMKLIKEVNDKPVGVELEDGRKGFFHLTQGKSSAGYYEIAGVGKPN